MTSSRFLIILALCCCPAMAFSSAPGAALSPSTRQRLLLFDRSRTLPMMVPSLRRGRAPLFGHNLASFSASTAPVVFRLRGGTQNEEKGVQNDAAPYDSSSSPKVRENLEGKPQQQQRALALTSIVAPLSSAIRSVGSTYAAQLHARPILTKSLTASFIFGLSDWTAQQIENRGASEGAEEESSGAKKDALTNWRRIIYCSIVGLAYFGPAAHAWYETIFRLIPGTSLVSTLKKAALGQLLFGPSFTCIFFASSLLQSGTFTVGNWLRKIRDDLPGAWGAGLGFWPLVDLISYSLVAPQWIPLFVNTCSFVWTIYLSMVANRKVGSKDDTA